MNGIRVNILTGEITKIRERINHHEARVCERCHHSFETRRDSRTRFCSMSCAKRGQNNRLGQKHSEETKKKMKFKAKKRHQIVEIVPHIRKRTGLKKPRFVNNPYKWANEVYGRYKSLNKVPHHLQADYGLYKYGEWLANNTIYEL